MQQEQLHDEFDVIQFNYFSLTSYLLGFRKKHGNFFTLEYC